MITENSVTQSIVYEDSLASATVKSDFPVTLLVWMV